ncbi:sirohydrochlorin chelatase [Aldersonia sp. NBC_00410]|uniref:sirohydrochlorin chelatase n=1 Tax=Aldersonia sp. NBC_00410 TaxID=2975954 RepID=UPI00225B05A5|nr:sirohydrochlorin chelatase [Aldersonia sp. NBC_00410]MCX5044589.1 sirohydrochlorin chelatase [Aldersonia sp. NBC_00410]
MSESPVLVLVAHGTRSTRGVDMIAALADRVREIVPRVRVAFVDVLGPSPAEILADLEGPAVVLPAFLASGYHVHTDVPREVAASGHRAVAVTRALGPDPTLASIVHARLRDAGWRPGDAVVLAAAGSSDPRALADVRRGAGMLAEQAGGAVRIGYIATGQPRVADVVAQLRSDGHRRVFVASYLLVHGLFQQRLHTAGADGVTEPIGEHPGVVELLVQRYRAGVSELDRVAVR